ncbi:MAG: tRNA dihydrouridine synthase DusB [Ignavibacteriae bacterium]|nr:tRNA dihydrouridine synthase DusB [Ignavibacteriota bacterium]
MFKVGKIEIKNPLLLAPMEDVTSIAFRKLCKEMGADIVYTEFVNSDGLIRDNKKTHDKLKITNEERPVGIQIYGGEVNVMREAAKIAEQENPEIIDINAGCWVKKVANRGAGAGLLKDPPYMQKMAKEIVDAVKIPVTVKTRLGWDENSIEILDVAKRLEDVGVQALTIHCRTRVQGHDGEPAWHWIPKIKEVVKIPVVVNGGIMSAEDALRVKEITNADGFMIARGAINHPWIFREIKEIFENGFVSKIVDVEERISTALRHLKYEITIREKAIIPFRKYYSGYLKGLYGASKIKQQIMQLEEYNSIEELLLNYKEHLFKHQELEEN